MSDYILKEGNLTSKDFKIGIIVSRFNSFITERLLEGCLDQLHRLGEDVKKDIVVYKVPGAFEIPSILNKLVNKNTFDGIICLGCVIRGSTPHFEYVSSEVSKGIATVSLTASIPIIYGILTTDNIEQAVERAGTKHGNRGSEAANSLIEMINLFRSL